MMGCLLIGCLSRAGDSPTHRDDDLPRLQDCFLTTHSHQDRKEIILVDRNDFVSPNLFGSGLAASHLEQFKHASQAMANRLPACFWGSGQFLRPDQLVGFAGRASGLVRSIAGCFWLSLQCLQLDVRRNADAGRSVAGLAGSTVRGANQRAFVERCLVRSCPFTRPRLVLRSALASGRERIPHLSGECQILGVLVYARGKRNGHGVHRCRSKILHRNWSPVDRPAAVAFRLALELCRHGLYQLLLFCAVLSDLPQSQPRQGTVA